jgi:hypothetical protein
MMLRASVEFAIDVKLNESILKITIKLLISVYPDKRAMGYPFDRLARPGVNNLQQFMTPNMNKVDVSIQFTDRVSPPGNKRQ